MYRQFNQKRRGGQNFGKKIKAFDPTDLINSPPAREEFTEYVIKHTFSDFQISTKLKENILQKRYDIPTPIQDQAIPFILEGRDLIGVANTGTGKTAAFLIPLIDKVFKDRNQKVIIITPTRELAFQIRNEFLDFSRNLGIYSVLCIGGTNIKRQKDDLKRNPSFVIGTPGRLEDHIRSKSLNLSNFRSIVLDEVDRMVDIGFIKDIKSIIALLPKIRQSLFFSATISGEVRGLLTDFVQNPVTVSIKTKETSENIAQSTIRIFDPGKKIDTLHELLIKKEFEKVLVFGRTKFGAQKLSDELVKRGFKADAIHGSKRQSQRIRTLERFKKSEIKILIATDVASRGLDIPNVSHVINYDLPESYEAYIHRIGRTGRADKKGVALTFVKT